MSMIANRNSIHWKILASTLTRFHADRSGNVAIMGSLLMVPLVGTIGLGFEVSNWYLTTRAMQNAAKAVAAQYGFADGSANNTVTVTKVSNTTTCSSGCYSVTIRGTIPLYVSQVIGFKGDTSTTSTTSTTTTTTTNPAV